MLATSELTNINSYIDDDAKTLLVDEEYPLSLNEHNFSRKIEQGGFAR
ncbi:8448_t:CDS:2, partial [Gigaspora rosea]